MTNIFGYGSFGGRSSFMGAELGTAEETARMLDSFRTSIESERRQDAVDFQALVAAGKRRLDLVFEVKRAEDRLASEGSLWENGHRNSQGLQAAQQAYESAQAQYESSKAEVQGYRDAVNAHAAAIETYWSGVEDLINSLPDTEQAAARASIQSCRGPAMKGSGICAHGESELGCKKCQRGRKRKQYQRPPGLFQQMNGGFLGQVLLVGMGQATTQAPVPPITPPGPVAMPPVQVVAGPTAPAFGDTPVDVTPLKIVIGVGVLALIAGVVVSITRMK